MRYAAIIGLALVGLSSPALSRQCLIVVDDKTRLNGPCKVGKYDDTVVVGQGSPYFAIVPLNGGEAMWNEERGANHAHTPLGNVVRSGACWIGRQTRVCVFGG